MRVSLKLAVVALAALAWSATANAQTFTNAPNTSWASSATGDVLSDVIAATGVGTITDVNVCMDLTHTWDSDVTATLIGPDGVTTSTLTMRNGGSSDNYTSTIFDDQAAGPISGGSAPFTGSFMPDTPLSAFNGLSGDGNWTLSLNDAAGGDGGTLNFWGLAFNGSAIDCSAPPPPPPSTVADLGEYGAQPLKFQGTLGISTVDWVTFTIAADGTDVRVTTGKTLLLDEMSRVDDSEIGLYDSMGNLIANNDDIDFPANLYSAINATLDAGTYYVAIGEFNTSFGATGWNVSSTGPDGGDYWINVIPEPGTALLLGLGVVGLIRRRRAA